MAKTVPATLVAAGAAALTSWGLPLAEEAVVLIGWVVGAGLVTDCGASQRAAATVPSAAPPTAPVVSARLSTATVPMRRLGFVGVATGTVGGVGDVG
ncbi:MAG: hypothetical protein M3R24_03875 [Chloroflexota bacterium]|nr:hypothetical protein [Chloroflexota bacterium]